MHAQATRIQLRASTRDKRLLQKAASTTRKTLSEFILGASVTEAEIALSNRTQFVLDGEHWSKFINLLERPVKANAALKKLLTEPSVLER